MTEFIIKITLNIFNSPALATFFISLFPIIEVKGAIPFGISTQIWGINALSYGKAFAVALLGSGVVCLFLLFALKGLFAFLRKKKRLSLQNKLSSLLKNKIDKFSGTPPSKKYFFLFFFALLPLPLTGVWSACLISSLLDLQIIKSFLLITLGNACSACLILLFTFFAPSSLFIFYFFLAAFFILFIYYVLKLLHINIKSKV